MKAPHIQTFILCHSDRVLVTMCKVATYFVPLPVAGINLSLKSPPSNIENFPKMAAVTQESTQAGLPKPLQLKKILKKS